MGRLSVSRPSAAVAVWRQSIRDHRGSSSHRPIVYCYISLFRRVFPFYYYASSTDLKPHDRVGPYLQYISCTTTFRTEVDVLGSRLTLEKCTKKKTDEYLLENLLEKTAGIGGNEPTLNTRTLLRMMRVSTPASVVRAMSEQHVDWAYDMVLFSSILQYILNVQKWAAPLSDRVTRVAPCMNALLPPPPSAL